MNTSDPSSPTDGTSARRTLYVGIGVIALLALAVVVALGRGPVGADPSVAPVPTDAATVSVVATAPGSTAPTVAPTPAATPAIVAPNPDVAGESGVEPRPGDPVRPQAPAADGSRLESLTAPPVKTIGMVTVPAGFSGATYAVTVKPYGWGPSGSQGGRLIALIATSRPTDEAGRTLGHDFAQRNATLWLTPELAQSVKLGGTYTGTMVLRPQNGDVAVLYLTQAEPAK